MKTKALLLALFALGLAAALAVSAPASGKGRPTTSGSTGESTGATTTDAKGKAHSKAATCKPHGAIVLRGAYVAAGAGGFAMSVTSANKAGRDFVGKQAIVLVDDKTRVTRRGKAAAADLEAGDMLLVQGRACKADAATGAVLARKITAKPVKSDDEKKPGTTTTTGTTTPSG